MSEVNTKRNKTIFASSHSSTSSGITANVDHLTLASEAGVRLENPAVRGTRMDVIAPIAAITAGRAQQDTHAASDYRGRVWNKQSASSNSSTSYSAPQLDTEVHLDADHVYLENIRSTDVIHTRPDTQVTSVQLQDTITSTHTVQRQLAGPARTAIRAILTAAMVMSGVGTGFANVLGCAPGSAGYAAAQTFAQSAVINVSQSAVVNVAEHGLKGLNMTFKPKNLGHVLGQAAIEGATAGITEHVAKQFNLQGKQADFINKAKKELLHTTVLTSIHAAIHGAKFGPSYFANLKRAGVDIIAAEGAGAIGELKYKDGVDVFTHKVMHAVLGGLAAKFSGSDFASGALGAAVAETVAELYLEAARPKTEGDSAAFLEECQDEIDELKEQEGRDLTPAEVNACCNQVAQRLYDRAGFAGKFAAITAAFASNQDVAAASHAATNAIDNNFVQGLASPQMVAFLGLVAGSLIQTGQDIYRSCRDSLGGDASSHALFDAFIADPEAAKGVLEGRDRPSNDDDDNDEAFEADAHAGKAKVLSTPIDDNAGKVQILGIPMPDLQLAKSIAILAMAHHELNPLGMILWNEAVQKTSAAKGASSASPAPGHNNDDDDNDVDKVKEKTKKGVRNPNTKRALDYGNKKHKEFNEQMKPRQISEFEKADRSIRPDAETKDAVHELKPGTASGVRKGLKQIKRYQDASEKPGFLDLYEPEGRAINLDEVVRKNFGNDEVVKKVIESIPK